MNNFKMSMALLPSMGKKKNDKEKCLPGDSDDDDFKPLPKRKKAAMFPQVYS